MEVRPFSDKQIALVKTFADQAAIAIENVRLFNETKEALEQQTATSEILGVISSSPTDLAPVFDAILASATRLCDAHLGVLNLYDGEKFLSVAQQGGTPEFAKWVFGRGAWKPLPVTTLGRMAVAREPIQVADVKETPAYRAGVEIAVKFVELGGARSYLAVPLLKDGKLLGAISIYRAEARPFTDKQVELVKAFGRQAVIAIENARLFNETKEALERQTATSDILRVISSSPADLQPVFDTIARNFIALCGAAFGSVFTYDGKLVHWAGGAGLPPEQDRAHRAKYPVRVDDSSVVSARTIRAKAPVHVEDALADAHYDPERARRVGVRRILGVPMLREGEPLGALVAGWYDAGPTPKQHEELLRTFADQAAIAIENVRLFNETKEALEQQTATSQILGVISSSPTALAPVFEAILKSSMQLCDAHLGLLNIADGDKLRTVAHRGGSEEFAKWVYERGAFTPDGTAAQALAEGRPYNIADARDGPGYRAGRPNTTKFVNLGAVRSFLAVPLMKDGHAIGNIGIYRPEVRPFSEKQVALVGMFANQAVIAIENVRLFNETKEALERQTATADILKVISGSPTDVQPVFEAVAQRAAQLCNAVNASVWIAEGTVLRRVGSVRSSGR